MEIPSHLIKRCKKFIEPYRVTDGKGFKLSHHDPGDLGKLDKDSKKEAVEKLEKASNCWDSCRRCFTPASPMPCW